MAGNGIEGIVPVMQTPMTESSARDYAGPERMTEWYLDKGSAKVAHFCSMKIMRAKIEGLH